MKLRTFCKDDAPIILGWIADELEFRKWSADRYPSYPPSPDDMVAIYSSGSVYPFTAVNDAGDVVGHFILRVPNPDKPRQLRMGFVILHPALRGKGYGRELVGCALAYAKNFLNAESVSLGVFLNNPSAKRCYEAVGFVTVGQEAYSIDGEIWYGAEMVCRV